MITLEQIRLLESKISRAIELIRVLKEENSTLRKGLESAQRRMRELETLVDGFKTDQKEIESVIVRTLRHLDELEESAAVAGNAAPAGGIPAGGTPATAAARRADTRPDKTGPSGPAASVPSEAEPAGTGPNLPSSKEELDIF